MGIICKNMVSITIDNIKIKISSKSTILEACHFAGIIVPRFCFHKKLSIAGNCRMCIVEIEKFPKPVSSCTLKVSEGMRIFTKTPLVRKAQETVLEFLLINHPLDCPICDQGGECDLQDQLNFFGSDSSRFFKIKRSVEDKNCSPFVKTIMTRCIHCTRCVRFLSEITGDYSLGMLGRSSKSEIGLYISTKLESEFSGNIIDLCPVGALTSKPYSFKGRSWELINYKTIDILDSINSDIIVSIKGSEILRILPCFSLQNISEWLPDRTRFFYDSFDYFRIKKCWFKRSNSFKSLSFSLSLICSLLYKSIKIKKKLGFFLGSLSDLETVIFSKYLCNSLGFSDIYCEDNAGVSSNLDCRSNYSFSSFLNLKEIDVCLLIGSDIRNEASVLNLEIRNQVINDNLVVGYIGPALNLTYPANHLGLGIDSLVSFLKGNHPFCLYFKKSKNPYIILGEKFNSSSISMLIYKLFNLKCLHQLKRFNINVLRSKLGSINFSELGINNLKVNKKFNLIFLLGVDDISYYRKTNPDSFIIYLGSHYSVYNLEMADLILPSSIFIEKNFKTINLENYVKKNSILRNFTGDIRPEWYFLLAIISFFDSFFSKSLLNKKLIFNLFKSEYPFLFEHNFKIPEFYIENIQNCNFKNEIFNRNIFNYYKDNFITRSSKNLNTCSNDLKQ